MYLDQNGNICQSNGDGGDGAARAGFCGAVLKFRELLSIDNTRFLAGTAWRFERQWPTFFTADNRLVRNKRSGDAKPSWDDPKDTSRDQITPFIIALALHNLPEQIKYITPKGWLIQRYPNGDLASPEDFARIDRALGLKPSLFGDFWAAQGVAIRLRQAAKNPDDVGDDMNCFLSCVFSYLIKPTTLSTATLKRYLKERPYSYGSWSIISQTGEKDSVLAALAWYCRKESGGNPELAELCRDLIIALRIRLGIS